jgi:hypothetical protein
MLEFQGTSAMAINDLLKLISPPDKPVECKNGVKWKQAQKSLDTDLPNDFLEIATHYGSGRFCDFLGILNPLSPDFESSVTYLLGVLRDVKESRHYPYSVFPDRPGLLPCGGDDNGNMLHWLTEGDANDWPVILESHEGELERFDMSLTTFLSKVFSNAIRPKHVWNKPFAREELRFVPKTIKVRKKKM